eukprot:15455514-Alexandrium_andersonii.AAC.1
MAGSWTPGQKRLLAQPLTMCHWCPWVASHGEEGADATMPIEPFQFQCPGKCQRTLLLTAKPRRLARGWP